MKRTNAAGSVELVRRVPPTTHPAVCTGASSSAQPPTHSLPTIFFNFYNIFHFCKKVAQFFSIKLPQGPLWRCAIN